MSEFAPDIVAFLEARLSETEVLAEEAGIHPNLRWQKPDKRSAVVDVYGPDGFMHTLLHDEGGHDATDAEYIVFWQPNRALALVALYRRIIDRYTRLGERLREAERMPARDAAMYVALGEVLIDLASLWREHPDWHSDWEVQ